VLAIGLGSAVVVVALQLVPLPPGILRLLSPHTAATFVDARLSASILGGGRFRSIPARPPRAREGGDLRDGRGGGRDPRRVRSAADRLLRWIAPRA
jgi:hypothetical protein